MRTLNYEQMENLKKRKNGLTMNKRLIILNVVMLIAFARIIVVVVSFGRDSENLIQLLKIVPPFCLFMFALTAKKDIKRKS